MDSRQAIRGQASGDRSLSRLRGPLRATRRGVVTEHGGVSLRVRSTVLDKTVVRGDCGWNSLDHTHGRSRRDDACQVKLRSGKQIPILIERALLPTWADGEHDQVQEPAW